MFSGVKTYTVGADIESAPTFPFVQHPRKQQFTSPTKVKSCRKNAAAFLCSAVILVLVVLIVVLVLVVVLVTVLVLVVILVTVLVIHVVFLRNSLFARSCRYSSMPEISGFIPGFEDKSCKKSCCDGCGNSPGGGFQTTCKNA